MPDHPNNLTLTINGTEISGRILYRSKTNVIVEIHSPYKDFIYSYSIPHQKKDNRHRGTNLPNRLLADLYLIVDHLNTQLDGLLDAYEQLTLDIAGLHSQGLLSDNLFRIIKDSQTSLLVDGDITEAEYQLRVRELRIQHSAYHEQESILKERFFEQFPVEIGDEGLKDQVIGWLHRELQRRESVEV